MCERERGARCERIYEKTLQYLRNWPSWETFLRLRSRAGREFSTVAFKRVSRQSNLAINAHNIDEETRELIGLFSRNFQRHRVTPPLCAELTSLYVLSGRAKWADRASRAESLWKSFQLGGAERPSSR